MKYISMFILTFGIFPCPFMGRERQNNNKMNSYLGKNETLLLGLKSAMLGRKGQVKLAGIAEAMLYPEQLPQGKQKVLQSNLLRFKSLAFLLITQPRASRAKELVCSYRTDGTKPRNYEIMYHGTIFDP